MKLSQIVESGVFELGISLPNGAVNAFETFYAFLEEKGENINLTAISGYKHFAQMHILDSLALLTVIDFENMSVIDVGSGAGFPGLPLKVAEPTIELTLLDATWKKVDFLNQLSAVIGTSAECIHARAEEISHTDRMRERFDISVSRAVARLNVLCELCLPFLNIGGAFLAMKSVDLSQELDEAQCAIHTLGAELEETKEYKIPGTDIMRSVVIIRKTTKTPDIYPRRYSKIKREPL